MQQVLNVLSLKPLDYHIKNLWNQALTNEELGSKFKALLKEYHQSLDVNAVGEYLRELNCQYYMHEFVKKAIIYAIEIVSSLGVSCCIGQRRCGRGDPEAIQGA